MVICLIRSCDITNRVVCAFLASILFWNPLVSYAVDPAVKADISSVEALYDSKLKELYAPVTINSNNTITQDGVTVDLGSLFGGANGATYGTDELRSAYGNDAEIIGVGTKMQNQLDTGGSRTPQGEAYSILKGSKTSPPPNLANDPILTSARSILADPTLLDGFAGCTSVDTIVPSTNTVKTQDIRTCERVMKTTENGNIVHDYYRDPPKISYNCKLHSTFGTKSGSFYHYDRVHARVSCNPFLPSNRVAIEVRGSDWERGIHCTGWEGAVLPTNLTTEKVVATIRWAVYRSSKKCQTVTVTAKGSCKNGKCNYRIGYYIVMGQTDYTLPRTDDEEPGKSVFGCRWPFVSTPELIPVLGAECVSTNAIGAVNLSFTQPKEIKTLGKVHETYTNTLTTDLNNLLDMCSLKSTCTDMPSVSRGCTGSGDYKICKGDLQNPPFSWVNKLCKNTGVSVSCDPAQTGTMDCFIDVHGVEQCPAVEFNKISTCQSLEDDPNCAYIDTKCVDGSYAEDGTTCLVEEDLYDCGYSVDISDGSIEREWSCAGAPINCMGDCIEGSGTKSTSFAEAYAYTQTMSMMGLDTDCSSGTCIIFDGADSLGCKKVVAGLQDCCDQPSSGFGVVDYIQLMYGVGKMDGFIQDLGTGSTIAGAWNTVRDPIVNTGKDTWESISKLWTSESNSTTAATVAGDAVETTIVDEFKHAAMEYSYEFMASNFSESAASMIIEKSGSGASATFAFNPVLQSVIGVVVWIYTFVAIVQLVVQMLWPCEDDEFELGAKRETKSCHYVGSHCIQNSLFGCIVKEQVFCCYQSPLARIVMEQVRNQGYEDWGSAKGPNCGGIAIKDIDSIDWSAVDLSEWMAYLHLAGQYPTIENLNLENLTGNGSAMDFGEDSVDRPNVVERTEARMDGLDYTTITNDAEDGVRSTLP